jgi:hypothetical protein
MGLLFYSIAVIKADVTLESVKTGEVRNIDDVPLFIAQPVRLPDYYMVLLQTGEQRLTRSPRWTGH